VQPSENNIAAVQRQVETLHRNQGSCNANIKLLPETDAKKRQAAGGYQRPAGLRGWTGRAQAKAAHRIGTRRLPPPPGQPAHVRPVLATFSSHEDQQTALEKASQVRAHRCRINEDLTLADQQLKSKLQPVAQRLYNEQGVKAVRRRSQLCWYEIASSPGGPAT